MRDRRDFFICHATGDKSEFARPLARALAKEGWSCWIDEGEISPGESLIDQVGWGLNNSRYVIPIITARFCSTAPRWRHRELKSALTREFIYGRDIIIPVTTLSIAKLHANFPFLSDKLSLLWEKPLSEIMNALKKKRGSDEVEFHTHVTSIDTVPVNERLAIDRIEYGYGENVVTLPGSTLVRLPSEAHVPRGVDPRSGVSIIHLANWFTAAELAALRENEHVLVPHNYAVFGRRVNPKDPVVAVSCTDIFYYQGVDYSDMGKDFAIECRCGRGGIADFVGRDGKIHDTNPFVVGGGLGSLGVITVVEFRNGQPLFRSPYYVLIRKGIRYPTDIWRSPKTGRPITNGRSTSDITTYRFMFQSRQPNGTSSDIFVADFDGGRMRNLSRKNVTAFDGFSNPSGKLIARWDSPSTVRFDSVRHGFHQVVTRKDPISVRSRRPKR